MSLATQITALASAVASTVKALTTRVTAVEITAAAKANAADAAFTGQATFTGSGCVANLGTAVRPAAYDYPGSVYLVLDKDATADDASLLFRDAGAVRCELGLAADNDLHIKTATGDYGAEVFTDRLLVRAGGGVDAVNGLLRAYSATGTPCIVAGNSDGTAGAGLELQYDQATFQATISSVERGNTYRLLNVQSNGINFYQGGGSTTLVASLSPAGVFDAVGLTVDGHAVWHAGNLDPVEVLTTLTSTAGSVTIDCALGQVFQLTLTENTSVAFTNVPGTGHAGFVILCVTQSAGGSNTLTWPAAVQWPGGTDYAVSTAAAALDRVALMTIDGGASWQAVANKGFA